MERELRRWISQRSYRPGDRLPPDVELASMLRVARSTVIGALDRMVAEGTVVRRQGSGTFIVRVPANHASEGFEAIVPQMELARALGINVELGHIEATDAVPVTPEVADKLGAAAGTPVTRIVRTVLVEGRPEAFFETHLAPGPPWPLSDDLVERIARHGSLLRAMLAWDAPVSSATTSIRPMIVRPGTDEASSLHVSEPTAALEISETLFCSQGRPIAVSRDVVLDGAWPLEIHRNLPTSEALPPAPLPPRGPAEG